MLLNLTKVLSFADCHRNRHRCESRSGLDFSIIPFRNMYIRIEAMLIGMITINLLLMMYYVWAWFDNDYGKGFVIGKIVKLPLRAHLDHLYAYVLVFVLCDDNLETLTLYLNSTGLKCLKWVLNTTTVFRLVGINKPWMTWWRSYFCNFNLPLHNFW